MEKCAKCKKVLGFRKLQVNDHLNDWLCPDCEEIYMKKFEEFNKEFVDPILDNPEDIKEVMRFEATEYQAFHNNMIYYVSRMGISKNADNEKSDKWRVIDINNRNMKENISLDEAKDYILSIN
jgi:hypothetical protein